METRREIEISTGLQVQKPPFSINGRFYRIYSSEKIRPRPCESTVLNLQLKIKLPYGIKSINGLLPAFIQLSLNCRKQQTHNTAAVG